MSYSNCQYLYLSNSEAIKTAGSVLWQNIPTLSQSSRECYITVSKINVVFSASQNHSDIIVKGSLPTVNYKSTDNSDPLIAMIISKVSNYHFQHRTRLC